MFKLTNTIVNGLRSNNRSLNVVRLNKTKSTIAGAKKTQPDEIQEGVVNTRVLRPQNSMVAAAFASLKPGDSEIKTPVTDDKIAKAGSVAELLSISEGSGVSRRHALKVVSTLAEWSTSGKVQLSEFENDFRFTKLCRILTRGSKFSSRPVVPRSDDLSTVLNITADDEAARLVANLTLPQAVKVMSTLSQNKRRSLSLLRSLSYNISGSSDPLNLKQSADLLYSMCILNYPDDNLVEKICRDVNNELRKRVDKSAVIGSIITSLGLLKYKNPEILDALSEWVLKNHPICRPIDLNSLFITLANVNYTPGNAEEFFKVLVPQLSISDARKPLEWLNIVWSLLVLNQATSEHISSVLAQDFVHKIVANQAINPFAKIKLLNISGAAAHLVQDYAGPTLPVTSGIHDLNIGRTREKIEMIDSVVASLKNLIQSVNCLGLNVNTGVGVFVDVKCVLDKKCNPLPLDQEGDDITRVAILAHDYHNLSRGDKNDPLGANVIASRLLNAQNYKVLNVCYADFKPTDKLVYRVQYLESKLKEIIK